MTVGEIYDIIDGIFPFSTQVEYDNSGLLVGSRQQTVSRAAIMLDCTESGIKAAENFGAELIISHHPLMFKPIKKLSDSNPVYSLAQKGIALISAHTNFDAAPGGINDLTAKALGFCEFSRFDCSDGWQGRMCEFPEAKTPEEVALLAEKAFGGKVKYTGNNMIKKLAVFCGSAGEYFYDAVDAGADGVLCGDIKHNYFVDAHNLGVSVFDAGHFETERLAMPHLYNLLKEKIPQIEFLLYDESYISYT